MQIEVNKRYRLTGEIVADVDSWLEFRGEVKRLLWDQQLMPITLPPLDSNDPEFEGPDDFRGKYAEWWSEPGAQLVTVTKEEGFTIAEITVINEGIVKMEERGRELIREFAFFAGDEGLQPERGRELFRKSAEALRLKMEGRKEIENQWHSFRLSVVRCTETGPVLTDDRAWGQWAEAIHGIGYSTR